MRDHILFLACVFDVLLEQIEIEQINHAQSAASGLVFIARADSARSRANLDPARSVLGRELNHAVVRENHMRAVADKQIAVHFHTGIAQSRDFFKECNGIKYHAVADYGAATFAEHAARDQLQDKSLAVDDDG